jgi:hypothetical protein
MRTDLPPFVTPGPTKLTPVLPGTGFEGDRKVEIRLDYPDPDTISVAFNAQVDETGRAFKSSRGDESGV